MRALVQSKLCWDARGLLAQTAAAAGSGLQRSRSLVQEQVERDDFIVMIPCDSTRRRRPFFRRRVSDPSRDNRSISRRASDSPARGRAGHGAISGASERSSSYNHRSFVHLSFVRVLLLTTLGEKTRNLTQVPNLALNDLGPESNVTPVALDLGFLFFSPPFSFATSHPRAPPNPLGPGSSSPTFLPPFVPLLQYQPTPLPFFHIPLWYQSLLFICFIHCFGQKFWFGRVCHIDIP